MVDSVPSGIQLGLDLLRYSNEQLLCCKACCHMYVFVCLFMVMLMFCVCFVWQTAYLCCITLYIVSPNVVILCAVQ